MLEMKALGIHRIEFDDAMVVGQATQLYGSAPTPEQLETCRKQLESTVLIEVLVSGADATFKEWRFTQEAVGRPRDSWQAPWAEVFLTADGEQLLAPLWGTRPSNVSTFRIAFFLHDWRGEQPLLYDQDRLSVPEITPLPERLLRLAPYVAVD